MNWIDNKRVRIAGLTLVAIIAILVVAYGIIMKTVPFRTVTVDDRLVSYSLEYPNHFKKSGPRYKENPTDNTSAGSYFTIYAEDITISDGGTSWSFSPGGISITAWKFLQLPVSASEQIEKHLEGLSKRDGFQLIERKPITVAGIEGYEIVYSYKDIVKVVGYKTERWIIILHEGREIWFQLVSLNDRYDQFNAEFNHVLDSFVILR